MEKPPKTGRVIDADRIRPISETRQIELKLTPRVGHHTSSPPLEAFGVTTMSFKTAHIQPTLSPYSGHLKSSSN